MKKIIKTCEFSTSYKKQEEEWEALTPKRHNKKTGYNSSDNKYYHCVKMELLRCQNGLCAYSEKFLCSAKYYTADNWNDGVYTLEEGKKIKVNLDHFDSSLKEDRGWLWDNFFATHADVNNVKRSYSIDPRLKPSDENFNPFYLFDYNIEQHLFIPNPRLRNDDRELYEAVKFAITHLGLNLFKDERQTFIEYAVNYEIEEIYQFPTAWEFWQRKQAHHKTDAHPSPADYE